jgi:hypothetical protein
VDKSNLTKSHSADPQRALGPRYWRRHYEALTYRIDGQKRTLRIVRLGDIRPNSDFRACTEPFR